MVEGDDILTPEEVEKREKVPLTFTDLDRTVEACVGESILQAALRHDIEIEHSCGGFCACSTCHVIIEEGTENLSEMDEDEEDRLDTAVGLTLRSRLSCQSEIKGGPLSIKIDPHR